MQVFLADNLDRDVDLRAIAHEASLSPYYFTRQFTAYVGVPPYRYLIGLRNADVRRELSGQVVGTERGLTGDRAEVDVSIEIFAQERLHLADLPLQVRAWYAFVQHDQEPLSRGPVKITVPQRWLSESCQRFRAWSRPCPRAEPARRTPPR